MPVDPEKERVLRQQQERLSSLAAHPGWEDLKNIFEARKEKDLKRVALTAIMGDKAADQRELDRIHGWWAGCSWLLRNPDMAESSLKKALAAAQLMEENGNA